MAATNPLFLDEFIKLHPADLADRLQRLPVEEARPLLQQLPANKAAATLAEIEEERLPDMLIGFPPALLAEFFKIMPPADAADVLQQLSPATRRDAIAAMPSENADRVRVLLRYPEDTAGGIMSNRFIGLRDEMTVEQVRELLRERAQDERTEDIAYLY